MSWAKEIPPGKPQERFSRPRAQGSTPRKLLPKEREPLNFMEGGPNLNIK